MKEFIKKIIPAFILDYYHFSLALLAAVFYGFPSKKLKIIGVTGTKGKSTVVELAGKILEEAGHKVASISSIRFKIGEKEWKNDLKMTMPGRLKLQRFLRKALRLGCQYVILEVTSEGILQHRHRFIDFDVALFTNLSSEHIEHHGSFEKYREAKGRLFKRCQKVHILNLADQNANYFLNFEAEKKWGYTVKEKLQSQIKNLIQAENIRADDKNIFFTVRDSQFKVQLIGGFNVYNALAAICVGLSQGVDLAACKKALEKVKGVPGRMEVVIAEPFKVMVDYAHTPDSLEKVYQTASNLKPPASNLICVLGAAGGGRDKWKRPEMGELAARYCDEVIVTNEDPYDESPMEIIKQVARGAENISVNQLRDQRKSAVHKILDRREAIKKALRLAKPGDTVIITGKGSEPWMCLEGGEKIPWDDRQVVREEFSKLSGKNFLH